MYARFMRMDRDRPVFAVFDAASLCRPHVFSAASFWFPPATPSAGRGSVPSARPPPRDFHPSGVRPTWRIAKKKAAILAMAARSSQSGNEGEGNPSNVPFCQAGFVTFPVFSLFRVYFLMGGRMIEPSAAFPMPFRCCVLSLFEHFTSVRNCRNTIPIFYHFERSLLFR